MTLVAAKRRGGSHAPYCKWGPRLPRLSTLAQRGGKHEDGTQERLEVHHGHVDDLIIPCDGLGRALGGG